MLKVHYTKKESDEIKELTKKINSSTVEEEYLPWLKRIAEIKKIAIERFLKQNPDIDTLMSDLKNDLKDILIRFFILGEKMPVIYSFSFKEEILIGYEPYLDFLKEKYPSQHRDFMALFEAGFKSKGKIRK